MKLDRDDDGVPLHDSEEGRAMSAARRLALRDAAPNMLSALITARDGLQEILRTTADNSTAENIEEWLMEIDDAIAKAGG